MARWGALAWRHEVRYRVAAVDTALSNLVAFFQEHRRCDMLDTETARRLVWMTCDCGVLVSVVLDLPSVLLRRGEVTRQHDGCREGWPFTLDPVFRLADRWLGLPTSADTAC